MITFLEYYNLLEEGVLNSVPRDLLGMETSYQNFPMSKPYGFWVDRSGNWIVVPYIMHSTVAHHIIKKANVYLKSKGLESLDDQNTYGTLYGEGWMRVQLSSDTCYYEFKPDTQVATSPQRRFISMCKEMYDLEKSEKDNDW